MMAVETVETHIEETGGLPYSNANTDSREEGDNNQKTTSHADDSVSCD